MSISTIASPLGTPTLTEPPPTFTSPPSQSTHGYIDDEQYLCDWQLTATHCREQHITQIILTVSTGLHLVVVIYAIWLIIQRNEGANRRIFTSLIHRVGVRVQPKPTNWTLICIVVGCASKPVSNWMLVFDVLRKSLWVRVLCEQFYWFNMSVCTAMHVVGVLYTIPVTRLSGNIAIYEPERTVGHGAHKPIRIIHPRPLLNTIFLFAAPTITFILGVVPALISAYLYDIGDYKSSKVWLEVRHWDWSVLFVTMSVMDIYYGIKFTRILKINILIAESIQGTPYTPFGLSNVRSKSPARFLLITHRIFLVGLISLGTVFAIAQTASIVFRDTLAKAGISLYTHFCTVMWTCTLPVATLIFLMMVHVQLLRNKRFRLLSNSSYRKMESKEDGSRDLGPEPVAGPVHRRTTTGNDPTIETVLELEQVTREGRREEGTEDPTRMSTPQTAAMRTTSKHPRAFSSQRISSIENGLWDGYSQYLSSKEVSALQKNSGHGLPPVDPPHGSWQEPTRTSGSWITAAATSLKPWPPHHHHHNHHHRQDIQQLHLSTSNVYGVPRIQESRLPEGPFPFDVTPLKQQSRPSHPYVERQTGH